MMPKIVTHGERSFSELMDSLAEKGWKTFFTDNAGNSYLANCSKFELMQVGRNYKLQTIEQALFRGEGEALEYWNEENLYKAPIDVLKVFFNKCWEDLPDDLRVKAHRIYERALQERKLNPSLLGFPFPIPTIKENFEVMNESA